MLGQPRALQLQRRNIDQYLQFYRAWLNNPTDPGHRFRAHALGRRDKVLPRPGSGTHEAIAEKVSKLSWYHTIELLPGLVTPGVFDHRPLVPYYGIPASLQGKTVLDVATFDGFWAFEFERRGASVTALDVRRLSDCDFPPQLRASLIRDGLDRETGRGFELAAQVLESDVRRLTTSVYDLDRVAHGTFDLVHAGDLLLHLERPVEALRRIRSVTREKAIIVDCFDPSLPGHSEPLVAYLGGWWAATWWAPSLDALGQMIVDAGFSHVHLHQTYNLAAADEQSGLWRAVLIATP